MFINFINISKHFILLFLIFSLLRKYSSFMLRKDTQVPFSSNWKYGKYHIFLFNCQAFEDSDALIKPSVILYSELAQLINVPH